MRFQKEQKRRKSVKYEATLPNGLVVQKSSFNVDLPEAFLGCFQDGAARWLVSGIVATPQNWPQQIFVKATRINRSDLGV